ncbi:serine recombinase [Pseudoscardovia radai]|uniref:Serine recombinase n=1 Tax=Pseudoscardovia radai TaxID=987066 RepID=A0A261F2T2_9BIFI|nr:integrase [Pseudoscardovia radai]OZG53373.1 serine recombinase [Pseudoscardovia radai]
MTHNEIFTLREQKSQAEADTRSREETRKRIAELQDFISGQETDITEFDEALVKKLIEKITVFNDHFTVEFKSGLQSISKHKKAPRRRRICR